MTEAVRHSSETPISIEVPLHALDEQDLHDLCDATDLAIKAGGGFGWVHLPARDILERYWQGVIAMPQRKLILARVDGVICGACQLILPPANNEAQRHAGQITGHFVAPWARGYGHSRRLLTRAEDEAIVQGLSVVNLDVRETQETAIQLYESAKYELIGKHPFYAYIDGRYIPGRYYTKCLVAQ